ncbi:MAG TPA: universal stress protein [Vicingaceae bacterium]
MKTKQNKILVPIDFSEQSLIALKQSYNLAKIQDAEIVLLYVLEELNPVIKVFFSEVSGLKEAVEKNLKTLAEDSSKESGVPISYLLTKGSVYNKIVKTAKAIKAKMIVMGTQGAARGKFIGSNSLRVVKTSPCPVITIKGKKHQKGCKNILLPLDLTKATTDKVNIGIKLAKMFNAQINVASIILSDKNEALSKLEEQINQVKEVIEKENIKCETALIPIEKGKKKLVSALLDYAEDIAADLILIMTQQENDFKELFIGSKAQAIINKSEVPVMSVLPQKKFDQKNK